MFPGHLLMALKRIEPRKLQTSRLNSLTQGCPVPFHIGYQGTHRISEPAARAYQKNLTIQHHKYTVPLFSSGVFCVRTRKHLPSCAPLPGGSVLHPGALQAWLMPRLCVDVEANLNRSNLERLFGQRRFWSHCNFPVCCVGQFAPGSLGTGNGGQGAGVRHKPHTAKKGGSPDCRSLSLSLSALLSPAAKCLCPDGHRDRRSNHPFSG